jgi:hypothetical protein
MRQKDPYFGCEKIREKMFKNTFQIREISYPVYQYTLFAPRDVLTGFCEIRDKYGPTTDGHKRVGTIALFQK